MWRKYKDTDYSVSDLGEIRKDSTGRLLSQSKQQGYKHVTLLINNRPKRMRVHRLVAEVFIENQENKPYVNHKDGDRGNNKVENLEWVTPSENSQHAAALGRFQHNTARPVIQYSLNGEKMLCFESATEAARQINGTQSKITLCCQRIRKSAYDYQWRYADDIQDVEKIEKQFITGKKVAQCDDNWNVIAVYPSYREAAKAVQGTSSAISRVCSGLNVHHKGYRWKIVEEIVQDIE